jgi:hypothetical protein
MSLIKHNILFYPNKSCNWTKYDNQTLIFYSKNINITYNECELACIDNKMCSGFEISQNETSLSPFCLLWYNNRCFEPNNNYIISQTQLNYSILLILIPFIVLIIIYFCMIYKNYCKSKNKQCCKRKPKIMYIYYVDNIQHLDEVF